MKRAFAILLLLALASCQTATAKPVPFEPEKHCDAELTAQAETLPPEGDVDAEAVAPVIDALSECGRYGHEVAEHNTPIAQAKADSKPGFAFGFGLASGTITVLAILKALAKIFTLAAAALRVLVIAAFVLFFVFSFGLCATLIHDLASAERIQASRLITAIELLWHIGIFAIVLLCLQAANTALLARIETHARADHKRKS